MIHLTHLGWHAAHSFYLMGDCIVQDGQPHGTFHFPDAEGVYRIGTQAFTPVKQLDHLSAPKLFPLSTHPQADYEAIDWQQERAEIGRIFLDLCHDFEFLHPGGGSPAFIAGILQYLACPEIYQTFGGKPSLWTHGVKMSGKSRTVSLSMRLLGCNPRAKILIGSGAAGISRTLASVSNLPVHYDEYRRQDPRGDFARRGLIDDPLRAAYNLFPYLGETPLTAALITGTDLTDDSALRSRYIIIECQPQQGMAPCLERMLLLSDQYHRIGRYLIRHRFTFAHAVKAAALKADTVSPLTEIDSGRERHNACIFFAVFRVAGETLLGKDTSLHFSQQSNAFAAWLPNSQHPARP
jgi:hypothetical protein